MNMFACCEETHRNREKHKPQTSFKVHLLQEQSIRILYQNRLNVYLMRTDIEKERSNIKSIKGQVVTEPVGHK